jgi:hypothetical protein
LSIKIALGSFRGTIVVDQVIPVDPGYIQMGGQYGHNSVEFLVHPRILENPESAQEAIASSKSKD